MLTGNTNTICTGVVLLYWSMQQKLMYYSISGHIAMAMS